MSPVPFIESDGDPQTPPPVIARGVRIWSFPLAADITRLQDLCDEFLNIDPDPNRGYTFRPLAPLVYLQVLSYSYLGSGLPPYSQAGFSRQNELLFGVPVVKWTPQGKPEEISIFCPYLWVDNSWSIVDGRCVFGYPKLWGWFDYPSPPRTYPFRLEVAALTTYAPTSELTRLPLVDINGISAVLPTFPAAGGLWPFGPIDLLFSAGQSFPLASEPLRLMHEMTDEQRYGGIQLKQFRDAEDPTSAAYCALVTMESEFEVNAGGPLLPALARLYPYASWPIAKTLGLQGAGGLFWPIAPYWVDINFSLQNVRNLYVAPS